MCLYGICESCLLLGCVCVACVFTCACVVLLQCVLSVVYDLLEVYFAGCVCVSMSAVVRYPCVCVSVLPLCACVTRVCVCVRWLSFSMPSDAHVPNPAG